jgi:CheY-like chemotaxis protein
LFANALKYTSAGGEITVSLTNDARYVQLTVKDSGCGIAQEDLEKVFQPFEQLDRRDERARNGLGLGLTIAQAMTKAHHGRLFAQSEGVGCGASFTLELPLSDEDSGWEVAPAVSDSSDKERKPHLLVVDDHPDTLVMLTRVLRRAGYQVDAAKNVAEAEKRLGECEVLVSDIGLPDGNGCDLMQRFKARGGRAGIAISGFGQEDDIRRSAEAGFTQHLVKPIAIPVLFEALRHVRATATAL